MAVALLCQENLPICGLWILLDMVQPSDLPLSRVRVTTASRQRLGLAAMAILVLCPVVIDASGRGLTPYRRFGWGLAQEIDPRLLDAQLLSVPAKRVIGWAPDGRSVGLAAWLDGNVLTADHPQRALLGGRAPLHSALITDLLGAHRARYRRDDGTWGGWVRQMADWRVNLVFVPVEMQALHRELTKTTWRPLDLDSPAVPFVSADDARYSEAILETMAQQGFVELGPWQQPVVLSSAPQVSERRCAECHSDITDAFSTVPHARTLTRATREDVLKCFAGRSFHHDSSEMDFHYRFQDDHLLVSTPAYARDLTIEWVFGSGTHARTPLITWTDDQGNTSAIEHSVSWYPDQELGVTLGMEKLKESNGILCLGLPRSSAETINCFGCHCTHIPTDGKRIQFEGIQPGIGCSRCHWNTAQHVHEMDLGLSTTIER